MPDLARYDIVDQLFATLHQSWLSRFSDAWIKWRNLDPSTRQVVSGIIDQWLETLAPTPSRLSSNTKPSACSCSTSQADWNEMPLSFLEKLKEVPPPRFEGGWRSGPFVHLLDDRPLVTPFEGTREATGLGAEYRIGGVPNGEQWPDFPLSPANAQPMTFLAQFPHPNGGTAYLFLDFPNLIATVITQWD